MQDDRQALARPNAAGNQADGAAWVSPELSVIVPTLNERSNVPLVVKCLGEALQGLNWEVVFVDDDSADGTVDVARRLARIDPHVRCMRRIGRRGLAGAGIEGILASSAFAVAVLDGDLQHDETLLPQMLARLRTGADLVVGTRFAQGGSATDGLSGIRQWGSRLAGAAARHIAGVRLSDPMSGFFMIRREAFEELAPKLSTQGFKLLLDILASAPQRLKLVELPYQFRARQHGQSKLNSLVVLEYFGLLLAKVSGDRLSIRFVIFALVGASGLVAHLVALNVLLSIFHMRFAWGQTLAAFAAMTWNFFLNNLLTYRDYRLQGLSMLRGLISFYVVCSVGAIANIGVASWVYGGQPSWWIAGTAGALMGAVFNYAASSALTWHQR
jgi:dolichol-phosphate mannosyltransferase